MCGIVGWLNSNERIADSVDVIEKMANTLIKRGPDDYGFYISNHILLGHRRLTIVDPEGGIQPMTKQIGEHRFVIVYNGELYNTDEVRNKLKMKGYNFKSYSDTEVLLTSYIEWGPECLKHINGIFAFAIWNEKERTLFLARDPLGVKPLFYSIIDNNLIFGSEIKAILANPKIEPVLSSQGIMELFGLGPARALGSGVFDNINEIPPAYYLLLKNGILSLKEYWKLKASPHMENVNTTLEHTRYLLEDAVKIQLVSDVPVCTFLSGGLDSSAISAITSDYFRRNGKGKLETFSIDYEDNEKYFIPNEFQPNSDRVWVDKMAEFIKSNHNKVILNNIKVVEALRDAAIANDLPGMADIDSSLYLFCREVRKKATVALSGECADEIFGGYPWFTKPEDINSTTFPWSKSIEERKRILSKEFQNYPIEEYVAEKYLDTIKKVPKLKGDSPYEERMRELFYLNIKWFMITLLNRKDRMSMRNSLEVRVPFADHRLVEYAFNIPSNIKFLKGREKGLLREALRGILPDEIIERKKSPYPKTHHEDYTKAVQKWMRKILLDKKSPVLQLIDREVVNEIVETGGKSLKKPWFGQLMTGPQLIAYLIQMNIWLEEYKVKLKI